MSSIGYGFAVPCLQLLSALTRRRVAGAILLAAAVVILVNGYRWTSDERVSRGDKRQWGAPLKAQSGYLGRTADNICVYPDFVLSGEGSSKNYNSRFLAEPDYEKFDRDDPTARARVGPSPQLTANGDANYTVIYNFASPTPNRRKEATKDGFAGGEELEGEDEDDEDDDDDDDDDNDESLVTEIDEDHITLATHASPANLHGITGLLSHWNADQGVERGHPISVAVYAPGDDFCVATAVISWLWTCDKSVRRHVSFHVVFPSGSANDVASKTAVTDGIRILDNVDCSRTPADLLDSASFRVRNRLPYPVNVARNVARSAAGTKYVLSSDIALLPSRGLADKFVAFVKTAEGQKLEVGRLPLAYVVPAFDLDKGTDFPLSKAVLADAVADSRAEHLDKHSCPHCHKFAGLKKWLKLEDSGDHLSVFATTPRHFPNNRWEPVLIGKSQELPLLDERLLLEGAKDRSRSAHMLELCLIGFRFTILDSIFLIRHGGVRRRERRDPRNARFIAKNRRTLQKITAELGKKYGTANKKACKDVVV